MQVRVGEGAGVVGVWPVGAALVGAGAGAVGETGPRDAVAGAVDADADALGLALRLALAVADGLGGAETATGDRLGMTGAWCSSVGALPGRAAPSSCGAASATTPAPPITSPAAVISTIRRPRPVRRLARPAGRSAASGAAAGSGTKSLAGAPQPGQENAPFRCRRHGTQ